MARGPDMLECVKAAVAVVLISFARVVGGRAGAAAAPAAAAILSALLAAMKVRAHGRGAWGCA